MTKIILLLFIFFLALSSCKSTSYSPMNYDEQTVFDKQMVIFTDTSESICSLYNDQKIYGITAAQLTNCLKNNDTSVVYLWQPRCKRNSCILLSAAQRYCDTNNFTLYVIAQYYDMPKMKGQNKGPLPIFVPNHQYYNKDFSDGVVLEFNASLSANSKLTKKKYSGNFQIFKGDQLIDIRENLIPQG